MIKMNNRINPISLDTICGSLAYAMGIDAPKQAAAPSAPFVEYIDKVLKGEKVDRILMYNPDAISQWIYKKYPQFTLEMVANTDFELPLHSVIPPKTPVCFGTMYTGAQPKIHGIQEYVKPVIRIDTLFDALIRAGKKPVIIADQKSSLANIYLERDMDYILTPSGDATNAAAMQVIMEDKYDFVVVYNGNYDYLQHRKGPDSPEALAELKYNARMFAVLSNMVKTHWKQHNTLMGFAMDHGSHRVNPYEYAGETRQGIHGDNIPEDMNIVHRYKIHPATK